MAALRELNYPLHALSGRAIFVSGYRWEDGIGPNRQATTARRDLAWQSIEDLINSAPMNSFRLLPRESTAEANACCEPGHGNAYKTPPTWLNIATRPAGSQIRRTCAPQTAAEEPYGVKYWCLGNEMDGLWQIGHLDAAEYGVKAREAAKLMQLAR